MAIKVNSNIVIDNSRNFIGAALTASSIYANGTVGTSGSVLTSTGSGIQWAATAGSISILPNTDNQTYYVGFSTISSGTLTRLGINESKLTFNPSSGTLSATVFTSLSDETQKTNIRPIENALELVKKMNGVKYDWKDDPNETSIGVIAQEIEKVLPEVVTTNDKGLKTVSYGNIIAVLIEAIKELAEEKVNV